MSTIRVAVVGDSGVGKTCLAHRIATGRVLKRSKLTVGCNVHLKLLEAGEGGAKDVQFVELWDIGGQERYETLWPLFLANLSGVILVYDITSDGSALAVPKWAEYVARHGTFKCPLADESLAGRLGNLAVPYLVVGNKSDLKSSRPARGLALVSSLRAWLQDAWRRLLQRRELGRLVTLAPTRSSVAQATDIRAGSLLASAQSGAVDTAAFTAFFAECAARSALAGSSAASRPSQRIPLAGVGATAAGVSVADGGPARSISTYRGPRRGGSAGVRSPEALAEDSPWRLNSGWSEDGRIDDDDF